MTNQLIFQFISVMVITVLLSLIVFQIDSMNNKKPEKVEKNIRPLDELLDIINFTIEKEILFRFKIEYEIKRSTKILTDYEGEYRLLCQNVLSAFNVDFLKEIQYYYQMDYILKYIARIIEINIIKYVDDNKIKTK